MMSISNPSKRLGLFIGLAASALILIGWLGHMLSFDATQRMWCIAIGAGIAGIWSLVVIPWRKLSEPQALHPLFHLGGFINVVSGGFRYVLPRDEIAAPLFLCGTVTMLSGLLLSALKLPPKA